MRETRASVAFLVFDKFTTNTVPIDPSIISAKSYSMINSTTPEKELKLTTVETTPDDDWAFLKDVKNANGGIHALILDLEEGSDIEMKRSNYGNSIGFFFKKCSDDTSPGICKSPEEIEAWTQKHSIVLVTQRRYIDYEDVEPGVGPVRTVFEELEVIEALDFQKSKSIMYKFTE